jgi:hypothetical protein
MRRFFSYPNPVNEHVARVTAVGVVVLVVLTIGLGQAWMSLLIAYGFLARVAAGPKLSPLAQFASRVVVPAAKWRPKPVPGPPKRFAQAIGAVFSTAAVVAHFTLGATGAAYVLLALLAAAAALEGFAGICLGCIVFARLMRAGVIPESVCLECADITRRMRA